MLSARKGPTGPTTREEQELINTPFARPLGKHTEEKALKAGYLAILMYTSPFISKPEQARSSDYAYFIDKESRFTAIPTAVQLPALKDSLSEQDYTRIEGVWNVLLQDSRNHNNSARKLKKLWDSAPETTDLESLRIVNNLAAETNDACKKAMAAVIDTSQKQPIPTHIPVSAATSLINEESSSELQEWQENEKDARFSHYKNHRKYITSLRAYCELLLEHKKDDNGDVTETVLPTDHPERRDIMIANRYLRVIGTTHQAIAAAKAGHHHQEGKRVRKIALAPYIYHIFEVTMATIRDTIPYIIEQDHLGSLNINVLIILAAIHDLLEDTSFDLETIKEKLKGLLHNYDSALLSKLAGAYGATASDLTKKHLDIINEDDIDQIFATLRILSKGSPLDPQEQRRAGKVNIAGKDLLIKHTEITKREANSWHIEKDAQSDTFKRFPQEHDKSKLSEFLIRLTAIKGGAPVRQLALIIKNEDRSQNLKDLAGMPVEKQFETLRETTTRLIAWQILDYDKHDKRPLYNSLRRLVLTTMEEYERIAYDHPSLVTAEDKKYREFLEEAFTKITDEELYYEEPSTVTDPVNRYKRAYSARASRVVANV